MTKGSDAKLQCIVSLVVILAAAEATIIQPSSCEVVLLHTQQPYNISANRTLVAEDVDPSSGVVWLKLYSRNTTLKSSLLGVGGHFYYDHTNLTVNKIYAGGDRDLVEIGLNKSQPFNTSEHLVPADNSTNSSAYPANTSAKMPSNLTVSAKASAKSPAFGAPAFFVVVLALGAAISIRRTRGFPRLDP